MEPPPHLKREQSYLWEIQIETKGVCRCSPSGAARRKGGIQTLSLPEAPSPSPLTPQALPKQPDPICGKSGAESRVRIPIEAWGLLAGWLAVWLAAGSKYAFWEPPDTDPICGKSKSKLRRSAGL